jgi:hypothetical protein
MPRQFVLCNFYDASLNAKNYDKMGILLTRRKNWTALTVCCLMTASNINDQRLANFLEISDVGKGWQLAIFLAGTGFLLKRCHHSG